jgi:3-hydroxyisobutyrate dehydrogenase-like beta-hydroxyacid dehydrogenase
MTTLGFIGIGNMGMPMARRLIEAGHDLVVHDTDGAKIAALGARPAASPREVADTAEIVLMSLPVPAAVRDVIGGAAGLAAGTRAKFVVDLSTTGRETTVEMAHLLAARGIAMVDAPVSGGVTGAAKGTLAVMVAASPAACEKVRPILDVIGHVFIVGHEPGQGQVMKVLNNLLSATAMAATTEVMIAGAKAGLDAQTMLDVLNAGSGRNTATTDKFPRSVLDRSFNFGFRAVLLHKDVRLCKELAEQLGTPFSIGTAVEAVWAETGRQIGDGDFTRVVEVLEQGTGVKVQAK